MAQELVPIAVPNSSQYEGSLSEYKDSVPYILKYLKTSRRFITSVDETVMGVFETKDFVAPDIYKTMRVRWMEAEIEYAGFPFDISVSEDEGLSWEKITTIGSERVSEWTKVILHLSHSSQSLRFKFEGPSFFFRWFRVWYVSGGFR